MPRADIRGNSRIVAQTIAVETDGVGNAPRADGPALTVDASAGHRAINPDIYGINYADEALAVELDLSVRRWGGNGTTRYNWQNDTANRASDWFFENIPKENNNPDLLPAGSAADRFVEQDQRTGAKSLLTAPLIGWTPKSREISCGYSVAKYGAQQQTDPWRPDCGNGVNTDGASITGNDPTDTSIAIGPDFVQAWIDHLIASFGTASDGGVAFYGLDNEPMLWQYTHRDVHPESVGYDELRDRTFAYAGAIKASDPTAQTLGPSVWGWSAYFDSAIDTMLGSDRRRGASDRDAHDDLPLTAWYLQQLQAYEQQHNQRILDYLDLHYYPQARGVALSPPGDADTRALRLRSTRSLWDPIYVDESWINEPVRLIPRMHAWVDEYYPGTKLAITEYNWGALDHINGALTQADVLGIFAREGVDMAILWAALEPDLPWAYAFRIYRNYDGVGGKFGDTSVFAASSDQDQLSIYAALRSHDDALTVIVINKTQNMLESEIGLTALPNRSVAHVYRYSEENLHAIIAATDQAIVGGQIDASFPAESITLFVIPAGTGDATPTPNPDLNRLYLPTIQNN